MASPQITFLWFSVFVLSASGGIFAVNVDSPGFLLTGPKQALSGTDEKFCLHLQGIDGASSASLELFCQECWLSRVYSSVHENLDADSGNGSCILLSLPIPPGEDSDTYQLRLKVHGKDSLNAGNGHVLFSSVKDIMVIGEEPPLQLIQTDKPAYKPGEKIRFRTVTLDRLLRPIFPITLKKVRITDAFQKVMEEWTNVTSDFGFTEREFPLSASAEQGIWQVKVDNGLQEVSQSFEIAERPLDVRVIVTAPREVPRSAGSFNFTVCVNQKVSGHCYVDVGPTNHPLAIERSVRMEVKFDADTDCAQMAFDFSSWLPELERSDQRSGFSVTAVLFAYPSNIDKNIYDDRHTVVVSVVPNETLQHSEFHLELVTPPTFKPSLPYFGKAILREEPNGKVIPDEDVQVCYTEGFTNPNVTSPEWIIYPHEKKCHTIATNHYGEAHFSVVPKDSNAVILNFEVNGYNDSGKPTGIVRASAKPFYSPSSTYAVIKPLSHRPLTCNRAFKVKSYLSNIPEGQFLRLSYLVTGRGDILAQGTVESLVQSSSIDLPGVLNENDSAFNASAVEFELHVAPAFYPKAMLTVFFTRGSELVTAQTELRVAPCFPNPATFQWDYETAFAGTTTGLTIGAAPGSLCGVSVVDESVSLLKPEFQLTDERILGQLDRFAIDPRAKPRQKTPDHLHCISQKWEKVDPTEHDVEGVLDDRSLHEDATETFDTAGLLVMSNWTIESRPCHRAFVSWEELQRQDQIENYVPTQEGARATKAKSMEKVSYVPEISLWEMQLIDSTGTAHLETTLPSKSGPWVGRVLCVSNTTGFGMSPRAKLVEPDPFHMRFEVGNLIAYLGEPYDIYVLVKNKQASTLAVAITLENSQAFQLVSGSGTETLCIDANKVQVAHFVVRPIAFPQHLGTFRARARATVVNKCGVEFVRQFETKIEAEFDIQSEKPDKPHIYISSP